jgi:hypothetical protein
MNLLSVITLWINKNLLYGNKYSAYTFYESKLINICGGVISI